MNEYQLKKVKNFLAFLLFAVCLGLVINGQKTISIFGLIQMLCGLTGLLVLLYIYNRPYMKQ